MKLWLVKRIEEKPVYDVVDGGIICAKDEASARKVASTSGGDENRQKPSMWLDPLRATCVAIGDAYPTVRPGWVLTDFHAG